MKEKITSKLDLELSLKNLKIENICIGLDPRENIFLSVHLRLSLNRFVQAMMWLWGFLCIYNDMNFSELSISRLDRLIKCRVKGLPKPA